MTGQRLMGGYIFVFHRLKVNSLQDSLTIPAHQNRGTLARRTGGRPPAAPAPPSIFAALATITAGPGAEETPGDRTR
jgi:hypothetical protein